MYVAIGEWKRRFELIELLLVCYYGITFGLYTAGCEHGVFVSRKPYNIIACSAYRVSI
jgi:hypothetical protein